VSYPIPAGGLAAVLAHPDDESVGCAGALALAHAAGQTTRLLVATRGEAGTPDGAPDPTFGDTREAELICAARTLGLDEVIPDCLLILDGGAETTRTVIARMILELIRRRDQWMLLREGADLTVAVEEFIRYVTPIHNMCRVATREVELGGETIRAGEQVVLMYSAANRDPAHFADPERLDVTRHPNQHLSFGFGTHFCLGASLARLEIRVFFEELVRRVREMHLVEGSVVEMPNAFVYGLRSARVRLCPP